MDLGTWRRSGRRRARVLRRLDQLRAPGYVPSEKTVEATLEEIFAKATAGLSRLLASHIHRVTQVVEAAKKHIASWGLGRSMVRNVGIARELGYLDLPSEMMVEQRDMGRTPDGDIAVLMTGSQGEPLAALSRVAAGTHRSIEVGEGDTVVIAAHPIPGNERGVARTIDNLMKQGADVHYSHSRRSTSPGTGPRRSRSSSWRY